MRKLFRGHNLAIIETHEAKALKRSLVAFTHSLDFDTVTAMLVIDQPSAPPSFYVVDNTPAEYLNAYYEPSFIGIDPVMQHCKRSARPIVWDQSTYVGNKVGMLWDQQARYGYRSGIALASHSVGGRHFFLGIDRDQISSLKPKAQIEVVAELEIFAALAQETAVRLFVPDIDALEPVHPLIQLEIDLLKWSMDGYSVLEVSNRMCLSESLASSILRSAMIKLRCSTKYQAIVKAIRLGLLP
jgi:DNA-binding CsgD family transcriptional regulator